MSSAGTRSRIPRMSPRNGLTRWVSCDRAGWFAGGPGLAWRVWPTAPGRPGFRRSEEHTSELQSRFDLVCRLLLEKKKKKIIHTQELIVYRVLCRESSKQ